MLNVTRFTKKRGILLGAISLVALGVVAATLRTIPDAGAQPPATTANPVVTVSVQTVEQRKIRVWSEFSGRTQAVDFAEIRPEVSGRITQVRFRDGQAVKVGEVLFVIDPRPYAAAVAKAEANLASARANAEFARIELERAANMIKTQAIPQQLYDQRANTYRVAQAAVMAAKADWEQARIDLDRAYVKAPIAGRVSRAEITVGNLVRAGNNAPLLTSIVSRDGIYADFDVDEQTYMKSIRTHADTRDEERRIPVELVVQGDAHPYQGTIYSFDNHIDTGSGTIRARARFANKNGQLVPGMFVSVRMASNGSGSSIAVPRSAIGTDQSKKFVYVVGSDDKVAYRAVTLGPQVGGQQIILTGLHGGERVIVNSAQHIRPGNLVRVRDVPVVRTAVQRTSAS